MPITLAQNQPEEQINAPVLKTEEDKQLSKKEQKQLSTAMGLVYPMMQPEQTQLEKTLWQISDFITIMSDSILYRPPTLDTTLSPTAQMVAYYAGSLSRDIILTMFGYTAVDTLTRSISGISWVNKALRSMPSLVYEGIRGAAAGAVKTGFSKMLNPDIDWYYTAISVAEYGAGDFSRELTNIILRKTSLSPVTKEILAYAADVVGGATAGLAIHGEIDDFAKEVISVQAVAMGVVDVLLSGALTGGPKLSVDDVYIKELQTIKQQLSAGEMDPFVALNNVDALAKVYDLDAKAIVDSFEYNFKEDLTKNVDKLKAEMVESIISKKVEVTPKEAEAISKVAEKLPETPEGVPLVTPEEGGPINTLRLNTEPEVIKEVYDMAEAIEEVQGKPKITFEEAKKIVGAEAEPLKTMTPEALVDELGIVLDNAKALSKALETAPTEVLKYRDTVVNLGTIIQKYAIDLNNKLSQGIEVPEADKIKLTELLTIQYSLVSDVKNISTKVAQTLSLMGAEVDGKLVDFSNLTDADLFRSQDAQWLYEGVKKANISTDDFEVLVAKIANAESVADVNQALIKSPFSKRLIDFLVDYKAMNILTNFNTHKRNVVSQTANQLYDIMVDYMAAFTGKISGSDVITFKDVNNKLLGILEGMANGLARPVVGVKDMYGIMHAKENPSSLDVLGLMMFKPQEFNKYLEMTQIEGTKAKLEQVETQAPMHKLFGDAAEKSTFLGFLADVSDYTLGHMRTLSYGMLEFTDRPFAYGAYTGEVRFTLSQLSRMNPDMELDTKALTNAAVEYRGVKNVFDKVQYYAQTQKGLSLEESLEWTKNALIQQEFKPEIIDYVIKEKTNPNALASDTNYNLIKYLDSIGIEKAQKMTWKSELEFNINRTIEKGLNDIKLLKLIQPFFHTPAAIIEKGTEVMGVRPGLWQKAFNSSNKLDQQRAIGALATSGLTWLGAVMLYLEGRLTPTSRDEYEQRMMSEAGIQENSIKIKDKWVNINTLDPYPAFVFTTAANLARALEETQDPEKYEEFTDYVQQFLWINANNLMNKTYFESLADFFNALVGVNPENYIKNFAQSFKPFYGLNKYFQQTFQKYYVDVNGKVLKNMPQLDSYGKPIIQYDYVMGLRASTESESPIRKEMAKLGYKIPRMNNTVDGINLDPELYYMMLRYLDVGLHMEDKLNNIISQKSYEKLPDKTKIQVLDSAVEQFHEEARNFARSVLASQGTYQQEMLQKFERKQQPVIKPPWIKEEGK